MMGMEGMEEMEWTGMEGMEEMEWKNGMEKNGIQEWNRIKWSEGRK